MNQTEGRNIQLGGISSIKGGKRLPVGVSLQVTPNAHPYIRVRDLNNAIILEKKDDFEYVDDETHKSIARYTVKEGDIVLSIVGTIGLTAIIGPSLDGANLTENCVKISDFSSEYNREFVFYFLRSSLGQNEIKKGTVGAVQPKLPIKNIAAISIPAIPLSFQKKIALILSAIDAKIELNTQTNHNLEEQAKAIFKSWFVDFEPFQNGKFVDSELGIIPHSWKIGTLSDLLLQRKESIQPGIYKWPYLPIDRIPMQSLGISDFSPTEEAQSSLLAFHKNDIIIGAMRVYFHRVVIAPCQGITRTTCFTLYPKKDIGLEFCLLLCDADETIDYAQSTSKGSTMPYAVWDGALADKKVIIPSDEVLNEFHNIIHPLICRIRDAYKEQLALTKLRDSLLPKLMSGEIDVSEVEI